jgi:hypothetical protein
MRFRAAIVLTAGLAFQFTPGGAFAHHSIATFDTTKAVRVKGTIVQVHKINPHSFIYLEETGADGQRVRWAIEGPGVLQLNRMERVTDLPKVGDVVEACGYLPKERTIWQIASPNGAASLAGRLLNAESLTTADGKEQSWGDYGAHKCFAPGYTDQHSR